MAAGEDKQFRWSQSIPNDWLKWLDAEVEKSGKTPVGFVRGLIRSAISKRHRKTSQNYKPQTGPMYSHHSRRIRCNAYRCLQIESWI
jgi:hypothetical protein